MLKINLATIPKQLFAITCLFQAGLLFANNSEDEISNTIKAYYKNWYQIEIIVFSNEQPIPNKDPETWPKNLELSYPRNLNFLYDPQEKTIAQEDDSDLAYIEDEATQLLESIRQQYNDITTDGIEDVLKSRPSAEESTVLDNQAQKFQEQAEEISPLAGESSTLRSDPMQIEPLPDSVVAYESNKLEEIGEPELLLPEFEEPFVLIKKEERQLNSELRSLKRSRKYKILFHEAWRQPILDKDSASNIVLIGGESFDSHNQLEGTIKVYLSRYLHISTNLWLNNFEPNFNQPSQHWPRLPEQPTNISLKEIEATDFNIENMDLINLNHSKFAIKMETEKQNQYAINDVPFDKETFVGITGTNFITNRIVAFNSTRRMRSKELHYIDHPLMGILVKITKFDPVSNHNNKSIE